MSKQINSNEETLGPHLSAKAQGTHTPKPSPRSPLVTSQHASHDTNLQVREELWLALPPKPDSFERKAAGEISATSPCTARRDSGRLPLNTVVDLEASVPQDSACRTRQADTWLPDGFFYGSEKRLSRALARLLFSKP